MIVVKADHGMEFSGFTVRSIVRRLWKTEYDSFLGNEPRGLCNHVTDTERDLGEIVFHFEVIYPTRDPLWNVKVCGIIIEILRDVYIKKIVEHEIILLQP